MLINIQLRLEIGTSASHSDRLKAWKMYHEGKFTDHNVGSAPTASPKPNETNDDRDEATVDNKTNSENALARRGDHDRQCLLVVLFQDPFFL